MNKTTTYYLIIFFLVLIILLYVVKKYLMLQTLQYPLKGAKITSPFGPRAAPTAGASTFHNGIDIVGSDSLITAPLDGTVASMWNDPAGGLSMTITHAGGWKTGYADLGGYYSGLSVGDAVKQGQPIAYDGSGPISTGEHLHFTVTNPAGQKVDPAQYIGKNLTA